MAGLLSRFGAALVARAEGVAERFIAQSAAELRAAARASNADPDPTWMRVRAAIEDEASGKRPPTEEYQDFPVSVWQDWTIGSIRGAVQSHVNGAFSQAAILVESMLADDRIQTATNGRVKGVTKCQPVLEPNGSKKAVKEIEKLWPEILPEELLDQILTWSIFLGFALCEVIWETRDDRWVPRLKLWHPLYIYYRIDLRKYVAISTEGSIEIDPDDPKWFLFTPWGSYRGWLRGAVRSCSIPWVVRQFALRDWGRFSEVHGLPIKKLIVPSQAPAEDKARFMASIARLGSESQFMLPQQSTDTGGMGPGSFDVQLLEAKDRAWEAFPGLIHQAERSITLAIRGTNLTTELDGGSFAAADVHRDEDSDYSISDRRKLASAIKAQLLRPFCLYNYGDADVAPGLKLVSPESDQEAEAKVWQSVSAAVVALEQGSWPIDRKQIADRYTIPLLEGVDPNEKPEPAAPPAPPQQAPANENARPPQQVAAVVRFEHRFEQLPLFSRVADKQAAKSRSLPRAEFDEDNITRDESGKFSSGGGGGSDDGDDDPGDDDEPSGPRERTREELTERHATAVERRDEAVAARDAAKAEAEQAAAAAKEETDKAIAEVDRAIAAHAENAREAKELAAEATAKLEANQARTVALKEERKRAKAEHQAKQAELDKQFDEAEAAHKEAVAEAKALPAKIEAQKKAADAEFKGQQEALKAEARAFSETSVAEAKADHEAYSREFEAAATDEERDKLTAAFEAREAAREAKANEFDARDEALVEAWEASDSKFEEELEAAEQRLLDLDEAKEERDNDYSEKTEELQDSFDERDNEIGEQIESAKEERSALKEAAKTLNKEAKANENAKRLADYEKLKQLIATGQSEKADALAEKLAGDPPNDNAIRDYLSNRDRPEGESVEEWAEHSRKLDEERKDRTPELSFQYETGLGDAHEEHSAAERKLARAERALRVHERDVSRTQKAIDRDGDGRTGAAEERDDKKEAS
jgi:hypothetical protein